MTIEAAIHDEAADLGDEAAEQVEGELERVATLVADDGQLAAVLSRPWVTPANKRKIAEEIGLDWWKYDRHLSPGREQLLQENLELREQLQLLERRVASLTRASGRRGRATGKGLIPD